MLIGVLRWAVELRRVDMLLEVALMSNTWLCRKGTLTTVVSYLWINLRLTSHIHRSVNTCSKHMTDTTAIQARPSPLIVLWMLATAVTARHDDHKQEFYCSATRRLQTSGTANNRTLSKQALLAVSSRQWRMQCWNSLRPCATNY